MAAPTVTLTSTALAGSYRIDIAYNADFLSLNTQHRLVRVTAIANESGTTDSIFRTFEQPVYNPSGELVNSAIVNEEVLPLGKKTYLFVRYVFGNGAIVNSNILILINRDVPTTPELVADGENQNIRNEDQGFSINPSLMGYAIETFSDGYTPITEMIVYVSKVSTSSSQTLTPSDFKIYTITLDVDSNNVPVYNKWYLVGSGELSNATLYEVSLIAKNITGISTLSNTVLITPSDVPSEMAAPLPYSLLSDQRRQSITENDTRGDIVLYLQKPSDFDNLITTNKKVTKLVISQQEYEPSGNTVVAVGNPTTSDLVLTYNPSGEIVTGATVTGLSGTFTVFNTTINSVQYNYKFVIPGSAQRLGKQFRYKVTAFNVNGNSPVSSESVSVWSFIKPELQAFTLNHISSTVIGSGEALTIYNGKMTMEFDQLSAINGGLDFLTAKTGAGLTSFNDVTLKLTIKDHAATPNTIFDQNVLFILQTDTSGGVTSSTGRYRFDFDTGALNDLLTLGTKYTFTLVRISKNPALVSEVYTSSTYDIIRTKFSSPSKTAKIECYAVNDDLTPTSDLVGNNFLRLIFNQLADNEFNGMQAFKNHAEAETLYYAYRNSLAVPGLQPIAHDYTNTNITKEILVPTGNPSFGSSTLYARGQTWNPELAKYISHLESSPQVSENTFGKTGPVSNLQILENATGATITYTKQGFVSLRGSPESLVQNRLILFKDGVTAPVQFTEVLAANTVNPTFTVTGLDTGSTYTAFVVAERKYTRVRHDNTNLRFNETIIVGEFATANFVPIGTPSAPTNVELFASNQKVTAYFDKPASLGGIPEANIRYHFYLNKVIGGLLDNVSVVDTNNDTEIVLDKAFESSGNAISRANLVPLVNLTSYYFNMRVIGTIGGNGVTSTIRNLYDPFSGYGAILTNVGIIQGQAEVYVKYTLTASSSVTSKDIKGDGLASSLQVIPNTGVNAPTGVEVNPQSGKLVVRLNKDTNINDLIIALNYNDALNSSSLPVAAFDTRLLRSVSAGTGGLISLDNKVSGNTGSIPNDVNSTLLDEYSNGSTFGFAKITGSPEKYEITIPNLVNGLLYTVSVRYCILSGSNDFFSEEVIAVRAPEAPPTAVVTPQFTVDSNQIATSWIVPSNTGGAGVANSGNSAIKYRVLLYSFNGTTSTLVDTINTSGTAQVFTGLTNGNLYKIIVAGFYTKSDNSEVVGPFVDINGGTEVTIANINNAISIKPNPAPTGLTFTASTTNLNNQINGTITLPSSTQLNNYPLTNLLVIVRHKTDTTKSAVVQTISSGLTTGNATINIAAITDLTGFAALVHAKPLNGFDYEVIIRSTKNYTYAQAPPDVIVTVKPYGALSITTIAQQGLASAKTFRVSANVNGTGSVSNIVALGKGANSNLFGVLNLSSSGANLPVITISGTLDNTTNFVAANQLVTFDVNLSSVLSTSLTVSDALIVVSTQLGSDALAFPIGTSFFV